MKESSQAECIAQCMALIRAKPRTVPQLAKLMGCEQSRWKRAMLRKWVKAFEAECFIVKVGVDRDGKATGPGHKVWAWKESK